MQTFIYEFEELPLVIADGVHAAFINGQAEVYYDDSQWYLGDISVEGFGERDGYGKRSWPQVPAPIALAQMIAYRLQAEWGGRVQNAVNEAVAQDRECAADEAADMRRDHDGVA